VVKIARRGVGENIAGVDCRARLKNESRFLEFLGARNFKCPRLIASDETSIVIEDIDGIPLHELPRGQIGGAVTRLAAAVAELHRLGVVHRDLKLSNAILAGTDVYVLDFELSAFCGATDAPSGGTLGHMPPERDHAPAAFAADIFALGASLAHAALGVDPGTLAPGAGRLRVLLESTGHKCVARLVAAAMHADPQKRPTAHELAKRLAELPDAWPASFERCQAPARAIDAKFKGRQWRKVTEAAIASTKFIKSASEQSLPIAPTPGPSRHAIAAGLAGNILGLAAIDSGFDDAILAGAEALARDVKESPAPGFFTGQAGIAFVLALVGQKYARNDLCAAGRRLFLSAAEKIVELDLFSGAAGIVWSAGLLAAVLRSEWPLRAAAPAARGLTQSVTEKNGVLVWPPASNAAADDAAKVAHLGVAHGPLGIALSLAVWGRHAGCARSLDLAHETFSSSVSKRPHFRWSRAALQVGFGRRRQRRNLVPWLGRLFVVHAARVRRSSFAPRADRLGAARAIGHAVARQCRLLSRRGRAARCVERARPIPASCRYRWSARGAGRATPRTAWRPR
jgi:hypothetical protein